MEKPKHHIRQEVCSTRAPYRDGRKPTAVKVYTIHHESKYLIVQGVPTVGASNELLKLLETVGEVAEHKILDDYPCDQFTEVHLFKYKKIQSARFAKHRLDDWSFYGGVLHICYAPEFETVQETREKLWERRRIVEAKTRQYKSDGTYSQSFSNKPESSQDGSSEICPWQHTSSVQRKVTDMTEHTSQRLSYSFVRNESPNTRNCDITSQQNQSTAFQNRAMQSRSFKDINANDGYQSVINQPDMLNNNEHMQFLNVPQNTAENERYIEKYGKEGPCNQKTSYAEQVVQQARSLQNYGKKLTVTTENGAKRPNAETGLDTYHVGDQKTHSEKYANEEQVTIPPPPKQMRFSAIISRKSSQKYGGPKVPSAQATFPADFDARTDRDELLLESSKLQEPKQLENDSDQIKTSTKSCVSKSVISPKSMQDKVEESLKNTNIVIKDFKKSSTVPKFIPRQAQVKMKMNRTCKDKRPAELIGKTDELNIKIRKNAFKLGKAQGPVDLGPSSSNESLDSREKSVLESMLEIRNKINKVKH